MTSTPTPIATELPAKCGCGGDIHPPDGCMKYYASDEFAHAVDAIQMMWAGGMGPGQSVYESPDQAEMSGHLRANGLTQDQADAILLEGPPSRVLEIEGVAWQMVLACMKDVRINYLDAAQASHQAKVRPGETWARVEVTIAPSRGHTTGYSARLNMERDTIDTPWRADVTIVSSDAPRTKTMFDASWRDGSYVAKFGAIVGAG